MKSRIKNIAALALAFIIAAQPLGALALNKEATNASAKKTKEIALKATALTAGISLATIIGIETSAQYIKYSSSTLALVLSGIHALSVATLTLSPIIGSTTIVYAELVDAATDTSTTEQSIINKIAQFIKRASLAVIIPAVAIAPGFSNRLIRYGAESVAGWEKALILALVASPAAILISEAVDEYTHKEASDDHE